MREGMTLCDYFAAKAMHAFLTSGIAEIADTANSNPSRCAEWAYKQADAMIKARQP